VDAAPRPTPSAVESKGSGEAKSGGGDEAASVKSDSGHRLRESRHDDKGSDNVRGAEDVGESERKEGVEGQEGGAEEEADAEAEGSAEVSAEGKERGKNATRNKRGKNKGRKKKKKKKKKKKEAFRLPYECRLFGYLLALCWAGACSFTIVLYGLMFDSAETQLAASAKESGRLSLSLSLSLSPSLSVCVCVSVCLYLYLSLYLSVSLSLTHTQTHIHTPPPSRW
jgi:hypothetical protein